jgi:hypothetical protein
MIRDLGAAGSDPRRARVAFLEIPALVCSDRTEQCPACAAHGMHRQCSGSRWIEAQQVVGLPHLHTPSMNRYQLIEVEEWLRSRYGVARDGGD